MGDDDQINSGQQVKDVGAPVDADGRVANESNDASGWGQAWDSSANDNGDGDDKNSDAEEEPEMEHDLLEYLTKPESGICFLGGQLITVRQDPVPANLTPCRERGIQAKFSIQRFKGAHTRIIVDVILVLDDSWLQGDDLDAKKFVNICEIVMFGPHIKSHDGGFEKDEQSLANIMTRASSAKTCAKTVDKLFYVTLRPSAIYANKNQDVIDNLRIRDKKKDGFVTSMLDRLDSIVEAFDNTIRQPATFKSTIWDHDAPDDITSQPSAIESMFGQDAFTFILAVMTEKDVEALTEMHDKLGLALKRDDPKSPEWVLKPFFSEEGQTSVHTLRHFNKIKPGGLLWPETPLLPARNQYCTEEEWLVFNLIGNSIMVASEKAKAELMLATAFRAWALRRPGNQGREFIFVVKASDSDEFMPSEGTPLRVKAIDHRHIARQVEDKDSQVSQVVGFLTSKVNALIDKMDDNDETTVLKCADALMDSLKDKFPTLGGHLTRDDMKSLFPDDMNDMMGKLDEQLYDEIEPVVRGWLDRNNVDIHHVSDHTDLMSWKAERIHYPVPGAEDGCFTLMVTLPLDPASKTDKVAIQTDLPVLDLVSDQDDGASLATRLKAFVCGEKFGFSLEISVTHTTKPYRAMVAANNDLHHPASAGRDFVPSPAAIDKFRYIMDFKGGNKLEESLGTRYPHMLYPLDAADHDKVDPELLMTWITLSSDKQEVYKQFVHGDFPEGLHFVNGVAGCGKTHLLLFIAKMATHGEKGTTHNAKILYVAAQNLTANAFAVKMGSFFKSRKSKAAAFRAYPMDGEHGSLFSAVLASDEEEESGHESIEVDVANQFMADAELYELLCRTTGATAASRKSGRDVPSLWPAAFAYFTENRSKFRDIELLLRDKKCGRGGAEESKLTTEISNLLGKFMKQLSGVVTATPYSTCPMPFRQNYQADIVLVDEATRMSDGDFASVIRNSLKPAVIMLTGDTRQLPVYVSNSGSTDPEKANPFALQMQQSTLHRAVQSGVTATNLVQNHRAHNKLHGLVSRVFYGWAMQSGLSTDDRKIKLHEWNEFLRESLGCATKPTSTPSVWVQIPKSSTSSIGTSIKNDSHGELCLDVALAALRNEHVSCNDVLIIAAYRGQVECLVNLLQKRVTKNTATPGEKTMIRTRTIDGSQGEEGQFVIVDYVQTRPSEHIIDNRRLTVALSRAREAQVVLFEMAAVQRFRLKESTAAASSPWLKKSVVQDAFRLHQDRQASATFDICHRCSTVLSPVSPFQRRGGGGGHKCPDSLGSAARGKDMSGQRGRSLRGVADRTRGKQMRQSRPATHRGGVEKDGNADGSGGQGADYPW